MTKIIIKADVDVSIAFDQTETGKRLHDEVRRLYDLDEHYLSMDDDEWNEKLSLEYAKVHADYCAAHTAYENAMIKWLNAGIESGQVVDMRYLTDDGYMI